MYIIYIFLFFRTNKAVTEQPFGQSNIGTVNQSCTSQCTGEPVASLAVGTSCSKSDTMYVKPTAAEIQAREDRSHVYESVWEPEDKEQAL